MQAVYKALAHTLLSDTLPSSTWYTAAEAAVTAVYALHPAPQELAQAVVSQLGKAALQGAPGSVAASGMMMFFALASIDDALLLLQCSCNEVDFYAFGLLRSAQA